MDHLNDWPSGKNNRKVTNIVMMGMGEPLLNYHEVCKAIKIMMSDDGIAISRRRITLSTSGIIPNIEKTGTELGVNLAISLHAVNDNLRDELVSLGNTRDVEGNFIFSGSKTETQPFVVDVMTGDVSYAGDNRRLFAAVSDSRTIQSNTDGTEIFQPVGRASRTYELTGFDSEGTHNFRVGESVIEFDVSAPLDQNQIKSAISSSLEVSQFGSKVAVKTTDTITPGTVTNYDGVLTVSDGITTVTKNYASGSPADLDAVLADIRAHASYGDLLFTVDKAANGTQLEYNWKAAGADYQVETVTVGTLGSYTALSISDGTTTITPTVPGGGAGYASVDAAVTAIKAATNYANLGFTVAKAYNGTDIELSLIHI